MSERVNADLKWLRRRMLFTDSVWWKVLYMKIFLYYDLVVNLLLSGTVKYDPKI